VRPQYAHAIDMVPTVLDALGLEPPAQIRGVTQSSIEGVSFRHTFDDAGAESRRHTQYFEMFGHRALYHDGWRAVCPFPGPSFTEAGAFFGQLPLTEEKLREIDAKGWELYHVDEDFAETRNLAGEHRDTLIEMIALWYAEAGKYNVFPLDSRGTARFADQRPQLTRERKSYVYYPHTQAVPENVAVKVLNRAHSITAEVEVPRGGAEGVLLCHGGNTGGYSLFVKDGKLHYVHNYVGVEEYHLESSIPVPEGRCELRFEFDPTGPPDIARGKGAAGRAQLYINSKLAGQVDIPVTVPLVLALGGGLVCGRNPGSPVSRLYGPPFAFSGTIVKVTVDVSGKMIQDTEEEMKALAKAHMARQ
jgi:arylsulfatase